MKSPNSDSPHRLRLAVLISGSGTTLQNFIDRIRAGSLNAEICVVISSRPRVRGIQRALDAGIPHHTVARKDHPSTESFSTSICQHLSPYSPDLICMGGFLDLLHIPPDYEHRVLNIHPSLLPAFGGPGYYGSRVHEAVLLSGAKESGCTVHFCTNAYDEGPMILQRKVPVLENDTPETLSYRVFTEECQAYPEAIRLFAENRLSLEKGRVHIS
ncbi:MAG: phosphoribosylglycinamide formyltransferase [Planctomycetota bacterium]|jgi:formyltetrahydrofolate-dependent phosphoribosylglycinamide formyltransferase|nr:phosphoribosylglycinamide formyltransferase [Planctomycetota bacterium]